MGRPTKLNEDITEEIVKAIKLGNYLETAAAYVGISKSTLYDWLRRGKREIERVEKDSRRKVKQDEQIYVDFSYAVQKALAESEMRDVLNISRASEIQWQAAAWRLERKFPDKWGRVNRTSELDRKEQIARINKLEAEIEKIEKEIKENEGIENTLSEYFNTLRDVVLDERS